MVKSFMQAPPMCPHNYNPATCYVCKAERVRLAITAKYAAMQKARTAPFTPPDLTTTWPRAIATVALRRIVDRAVSDELHSPATADILRIALLALNQLED